MKVAQPRCCWLLSWAKAKTALRPDRETGSARRQAEALFTVLKRKQISNLSGEYPTRKGLQKQPGFLSTWLPFLEFWTSRPFSPYMSLILHLRATLSMQNSTTVLLETVKHDNMFILSIVGNLKCEIILISHHILLITQTWITSSLPFSLCDFGWLSFCKVCSPTEYHIWNGYYGDSSARAICLKTESNAYSNQVIKYGSLLLVPT